MPGQTADNARLLRSGPRLESSQAAMVASPVLSQ